MADPNQQFDDEIRAFRDWLDETYGYISSKALQVWMDLPGTNLVDMYPYQEWISQGRPGWRSPQQRNKDEIYSAATTRIDTSGQIDNPNLFTSALNVGDLGTSYEERYEDFLMAMLYNGTITAEQVNEHLEATRDAILSGAPFEKLPFWEQMQRKDFQAQWGNYFIGGMSQEQAAGKRITSQQEYLKNYEKDLGTAYNEQASIEERAQAIANSDFYAAKLEGKTDEEAKAKFTSSWYSAQQALNAKKQAEQARIATGATGLRTKEEQAVGRRVGVQDVLAQQESARAQAFSATQASAERPPNLEERTMRNYQGLMATMTPAEAEDVEALYGKSPAQSEFYQGQFGSAARAYNAAVQQWNWAIATNLSEQEMANMGTVDVTKPQILEGGTGQQSEGIYYYAPGKQEPVAQPRPIEQFPNLETWTGKYDWYKKFISTPPAWRPGGRQKEALSPRARYY